MGGVVWCGVVWCVVCGAWRVPWHMCVVNSNTCMATRCAKPSDHACVDGHTVGGLQRPEKFRALRAVPAQQICSVSKLVWCYWGRCPLRQAEPTSSTSRDKSTHTQRRTGREREREREQRERETWTEGDTDRDDGKFNVPRKQDSTARRHADTQTRRHADTQLAPHQPRQAMAAGWGTEQTR